MESKSKREVLEQELHNVLLQLHSAQLGQLPSVNGSTDPNFKPDVNNIKRKLEEELKRSPTHAMKSEYLSLCVWLKKIIRCFVTKIKKILIFSLHFKVSSMTL